MPDNARAILDGDRLDTGMKASEAVARAEAWWNATGRKMILDACSDAVMRQLSGVLGGAPWDQLTKREKLAVVKVWHHFKIRRADTLDIAPDAPFKLGGKERVQ